MGIVYEAYQESLGRHVAVKVLPRQSLLDAKHLQRFQRESQMAARLHHTNIVPVFGVGEQEGFHYIVMQLIEGVGLDVILALLQQAGPGGVALREKPAGSASRADSSREAARLVEMLVEGRFSQLRESGYSSDGSGDSPVCPEAEKTSVPVPPSFSESAETRDFRIVRDNRGTVSSETPNTPELPASPPPISPEPRQFGPLYWRRRCRDRPPSG